MEGTDDAKLSRKTHHSSHKKKSRNGAKNTQNSRINANNRKRAFRHNLKNASMLTPAFK